MEPDFYAARNLLIWAHTQAGRWREAISEIERGRAMGDNPAFAAKLGQAYAASERRDQASKVLEELTAQSERGYVDGNHLATVYIGLGDQDRAIEWLNRAFDDGSVSVAILQVDPACDPLRDCRPRSRPMR